MALLSGANLTLYYERVAALQEVSFTVSQGDYLCIVGENGSGKSSLMKAILGLVPISSGTLQLGDGLRRTQIGYLPQQAPTQRDFPAVVEEIVLSGCLNRMAKRATIARCSSVVSMVKRNNLPTPSFSLAVS